MFDFSAPLFWYKLVFAAELMIAEILAVYTLKKKRNFALRASLCVAGIFMFAFLYPLLSYSAWYSTLMFFIFLVITVIGLVICFNESIINLIFCAIIAYTVQHISYETYSLVSLLADFESINVYMPQGAESVTEFTAVSISVYFIIYAVIYWFVWAFVEVRIRSRKELVLNNSYLLVWAAVTVVIDIIFSAIVTYADNGRGSETVTIIFTCSNIVACVLAIGLLFLMLDKNEAQKDLKIISSLWQKDKERYELMRENIEVFNVKCHDIKSQLSALRNINGFVDQNAISEMENTLNMYGVNLKTGNDALDVILAEKHMLCEKNKIKLYCMVDGAALGFISPVNLYSLFGNALQNAIEASLKIDDVRQRVIRLNVKTCANMVSVHVENRMPSEKLDTAGGLPKTTKEDKREHGWGMRSMQLIAEKFGGGISFKAEDGWFFLDIIFPIPTASAASAQ